MAIEHVPKAYSLDQLAGKSIKITLGGKEYEAHPITLGDYAAFEQYVRQENYRTATANAAELPKDVVRDVCLRLLSGSFSNFDIQQHLATMSGLRFMLHRSLMKSAPDLTIEDVDGPITEMNEALDAIMSMSGFGGEGENPPEAQSTGEQM